MQRKKNTTPDHDQGPLPKEAWRGIIVSANSPIDYENSNDFPIPSPTDNVSGSPDLVKVTQNDPLLYLEPRQFWSKLFLHANLPSSRRWLHLIDSTWIFVVAIPDLWSSLMNQNWSRIPYFHVCICILILQKMHSSFDSTHLRWNITASLSSTCSPRLRWYSWTNSSGGHSTNFETVDKLKHLPRFFLINFLTCTSDNSFVLLYP